MGFGSKPKMPAPPPPPPPPPPPDPPPVPQRDDRDYDEAIKNGQTLTLDEEGMMGLKSKTKLEGFKTLLTE
jgi:hypothetical protein